jgi:hypothetical protein
LGESVLFPLLGTGYGHGDVEHTVRVFLGSVSSYLVERPTAIREVYLLAYTDVEFEVFKNVFAESDRVLLPEKAAQIATRRNAKTKAKFAEGRGAVESTERNA